MNSAGVELVVALVVVIVLLAITAAVLGWKLRAVMKARTQQEQQGPTASVEGNPMTWPEPAQGDEQQQLKSVE